MDARAHAAFKELVHEATVEERDELIRLSLAVERLEERIGLRRPAPKAAREQQADRERRRRQVVRLADKGLSVTQIARQLGISRSTARSDLEALGVRLKGAVSSGNGDAPARNGSPPAERTAARKYRPPQDHPWRPLGRVASPP